MNIVSPSAAAELETMKTMFSEKEQELATTRTRAEQLGRQLEGVKVGRVNGNTAANDTVAAEFLEIEKLRKDLVVSFRV